MDTKTIDKLLLLSQLHLSESEREVISNDLDNILRFVETMHTVDTTEIQPLAHPVDIAQPMRADEVHSDFDRNKLQGTAPAVEDGYYIVPKVIASR